MSLNKVVLKFVHVSFSVLVALLVVVGLMKLGMFCYEFGYRMFTETAVDEAPGTDKEVTIPDGAGGYQIARQLKKEGLIRDEKLFFAQLKLSAYASKLKAGTYTLNTSMTSKEIMAFLASESTEHEETEKEPDAKQSVRTDTEQMPDGGAAGEMQ